MPLIGHIISQKNHNNQYVNAALIKAWDFAVPFSWPLLSLVPTSSCSNSAVKIILTKSTSNYMECQWLTKIISPLQSAFVPSRNIQDNTILAHELLHTFKNKKWKGGFMFLKINM
jgi:hypothetical protein